MAHGDSSFLPTAKFMSLAWWDATSSDDEHYKPGLYLFSTQSLLGQAADHFCGRLHENVQIPPPQK